MSISVVAPPVPFFLARVSVRRVHRIGASYVRVVLAGERVREVADNRLDQRIKVLLPAPGLAGIEDLGGDWYSVWRSLPEHERPVMRTYTIREVRAELGEFDVDIALHGEVGPGSAWALHARPGDEIVVTVPHAHWRGEHGGVDWRAPAGVRHVLLAGDETAAPAIAGILERLPEGTRGLAVLELPDMADAAVLGARPSGVEVVVLERTGAVGERLVETVMARAAEVIPAAVRGGAVGPLDEVDVDTALLWEVADGTRTFAAWLAGEAGAIRRLRRHLVSDLGVDRSLVSFMGYWRLGRSEANG